MTDKTLRLILGNQLFPLEIQKIEELVARELGKEL